MEKIIIKNSEIEFEELETKVKRKILSCGDSFFAGENVEHGVRALEDSVILDVFTPQREDFLS